jgi:ATP-dependent exoDNAse (exonuclease V) beta subunit
VAVTELAVEREPRVKAPATRGQTFGTFVHELLRAADLRGTGARVAAAALAPRYRVPAEDVGEAAGIVERTLALPLFDEARTAERLAREMPFVCQLDGRTVSGQIDLAYLKDGRWTLVDFKTETVDDVDEAVRRHAAQVSLYRRALEGLVGARPRAFLCFVQTGSVVPVEAA